jgi:hypothetical protein
MHRKIYQAIRAGKADAARAAMTTHLELAQRDFASEEAAEKDGSHAGKNGGFRARVNGKGKRSSKGAS